MRAAAREGEIDAAYRDVAAVAGRLNRAHAELVALTVQVLDGELWGGDGIRSPEHWLCLYAGLSASRAREVVRLARRAAELPATLAALEAARISVDHAAVVARYAPADHDESVAATAQQATVSQLTRALSRYQFSETVVPPASHDSGSGTKPEPGREGTADGYPVADPWGPNEPGSVAYACAPPELSMGLADGWFTLRFSAPADVGVLVEQAVREAKDALFTAGHAAATHADALVEVATRSLAAVTATGRAARYRTYIHLSVDGGWVGGKGAIPPRLAAKFACDGVIQPLWEKNGLPVSVGREQRIVPDRTRRLIEDRDHADDWLPVPRLHRHSVRRSPPRPALGRRRTHRHRHHDLPLPVPPRPTPPRPVQHHRQPWSQPARPHRPARRGTTQPSRTS